MPPPSLPRPGAFNFVTMVEWERAEAIERAAGWHSGRHYPESGRLSGGDITLDETKVVPGMLPFRVVLRTGWTPARRGGDRERRARGPGASSWLRSSRVGSSRSIRRDAADGTVQTDVVVVLPCIRRR